MNYPALSGFQVSLLPIKQAHIEQLRMWRNSEHVSKQMLSHGMISKTQQEKWFAGLKEKTTERHYVIKYKDDIIGSCNIKSYSPFADKTLVDVQHSKAFEMGLYIGDRTYAGNILAFSPTLVMNDYCFNTLNAEFLYAVVKSSNLAALRYNEKLGYRVVSSGDVITLRLSRDDYEEASFALKRLLNRPRKQQV